MSAPSPRRVSAFALLIGAAVAAGIAGRLSPLLDPQGRLFWQYMTEDGYLMQTIARNMALGLGMSTAEGTLPTNGVQPLATFLFAGLHALAGGSKPGAIALVTVFSAMVSAAAAYLMYRVCARVFASLHHGRALAGACAALWLVAPHIVAHSMNGLETGLYYLAILATLHYYLAAVAEGAPWGTGSRAMLGVLLGVSFLARNDAVFFIGALLLAHLLMGDEKAGAARRRLMDCLVAGTVSVLVASPWLVSNYLRFGSIVPISGTALSHTATLGQNLILVPANLFEATTLFVPVPRSLEASVGAIAVAIPAVAASVVGFWLFAARRTLAGRRFLAAGLLFGAAVCGYYGAFFGAHWFLPRYFSPLSIFLWPATCATAYFLLSVMFASPAGLQRAALAVTALFVIEGCAFLGLDFRRGQSHMHRQVVDWVRANVPPSEWVGAVQTGTLGFFHDRTINLDGKVNPEALRARMEEGHVQDYVLRTRVRYLADWVGIAAWAEPARATSFSQAFAVIVKDEQRNLAVLRRLTPVD